jgi:hypothetical protein
LNSDSTQAFAGEEIRVHNSGVREIFASIPPSLSGLLNSKKQSSSRPENSLPESPIKSSIQNSRMMLELSVENAGAGESQKIFTRASQFLSSAAKYASVGDVSRANHRTNTANAVIRLASEMGSRNLEGVPDADGLNRGVAYNAGLEALDTAIQLDKLGKGFIADYLSTRGVELLNAALNVSRMVGVIDGALNVVEAVSGKTIEFGSDGQLEFRDVTSLERGFAIVSLAVDVAGAIVGGPAGVVAAGVVSDISRAILVKETRHDWPRAQKRSPTLFR